MLLIGSAALKKAGVDWQRPPSDIDYIATRAEVELYKQARASKLVHIKKTRVGETLFIEGSLPVEFEIAEPNSSAQHILENAKRGHHYTIGPEINAEGLMIRLASPQLVYALKMSHRYLKDSPHFMKTMNDIHELRRLGFGRALGATILRPDIFTQRVKETYWYKHPSLAQSKDTFFSDDNVPYKYDHDSLHEAVKFFDKPAFELIKKDKAEVFCSKEKFMDAPDLVKNLTVYEEAAVLALERSLIPYDFKPAPAKAFTKALEKICTSIASGWWREYAWENYHTIMKMYDGGTFVRDFERALKTGIVKPYKVTAEPVVKPVVKKLPTINGTPF